MMETLTKIFTNAAKKEIENIDKIGGMSKAIEQGIPKLNIEKVCCKEDKQK